MSARSGFDPGGFGVLECNPRPAGPPGDQRAQTRFEAAIPQHSRYPATPIKRPEEIDRASLLRDRPPVTEVRILLLRGVEDRKRDARGTTVGARASGGEIVRGREHRFGAQIALLGESEPARIAVEDEDARAPEIPACR